MRHDCNVVLVKYNGGLPAPETPLKLHLKVVHIQYVRSFFNTLLKNTFF